MEHIVNVRSESKELRIGKKRIRPGVVVLLARSVPPEAWTPAPLFLARVPAGFPSPADDYVESALDLNEYLVRHPAATFMVRVCGDSMAGAGIADGDVLVVDRSVEASDGRIVVAVVDGEMTVKRLRVRRGRRVLQPENPAYAALEIQEGQDARVWGVVTGVVRRI